METVAYRWRMAETILVVEDEVIIRLGIAEFLREQGYVVHEAGMASEAIEVLKTGPLIDLVITDVRMPGEMDGFALARWMRTYAPEVKVILTSGVVTTDTMGNVVQLIKPYTKEHMLKVIQSVVMERGAVAERAEGVGSYLSALR
jgi:CheY-like chemotaxis protein